MSEERFEQTVRALLNTKPETQRAVVKRERGARLLKKLDLAELERLAALAKAYESMPADDAEWDDVCERWLDAQPLVTRALCEYLKLRKQP